LGMDGLEISLNECQGSKRQKASVQVCDWRICTHSLWIIGYTEKNISVPLNTSQWISMHVDWKTKYSELYQYQLTATWITFW
jgi:hypothetical protein